MSDTALAYSTHTGQIAPTIDVTIVEHHRPATLRVTDPRYGLKTAARLAAETANKKMFADQRKTALTSQRDKTQKTLSSLQAEILRIMSQLETGKITGPQRVEDAFSRLARMGKTEARLVTDITRLNEKIGA